MADLATLFELAESKLPGTRLRQTSSQEVLELRGVQGIAWRPLANRQVLQLYPPTAGRRASREGPFLVVRDSKTEVKYRDPEGKLNSAQWSYVGCSDCSTLADSVVWGWIQDAYEHLRRNRGRGGQ